jgi:hypothetical protein
VKVGLLAVPKFSVAVLAGVAVSGTVTVPLVQLNWFHDALQHCARVRSSYDGDPRLIAGGLAAMQNHTERTRPIVLRGSATAAYGIKNDPFTYLGLWGIGMGHLPIRFVLSRCALTRV